MRYSCGPVRCRCFVALLLITGVITLGGGVAARADEIKVTPLIELREEFNDNILFSTLTQKSDFVTTVSPSIALADNSARYSASILGGINWLTYARTIDLNSVDYLYRAQGGYRFSPLTDLGASGAYVSNSRPDSINQGDNAGSTRQNYSFRVGHKISELVAGTASYAFGRVDYDNPTLLGNDVHTAGLAITKDLGNLLKGTVSSGYSRNNYRDAQNDDYSLSIGTSWQQSERLSLNASMGGRFTHSSFSVLHLPALQVTEESNGNWGVTGALSLAYAGETYRSALSFNRDFVAASGRTGATERTQVSLSLGQQFLENFSGQAAISYNINNSPAGQFSAQGTDERAIRCSGGLNYDMFRKHLSLGLLYNFSRIDYSPSNQSAVQNVVMLQAQWKYPIDKFVLIDNK